MQGVHYFASTAIDARDAQHRDLTVDDLAGRHRQTKGRCELAGVGLVHDGLAQSGTSRLEDMGRELPIEHEHGRAIGVAHRQFVKFTRQGHAQTVSLRQQRMDRQDGDGIAQLGFIQPARRTLFDVAARHGSQAEGAGAVARQARQQGKIITLRNAHALRESQPNLALRQQVAEHRSHAVALIRALAPWQCQGDRSSRAVDIGPCPIHEGPQPRR